MPISNPIGDRAFRRYNPAPIQKIVLKTGTSSLNGICLEVCGISRQSLMVSDPEQSYLRSSNNRHVLGHAGHETVDYLVDALPAVMEKLLKSSLSEVADGSLSPTSVSQILVRAISEVDDAITRDILNLFPGGPESIQKLSDKQINAIVNDFDSGGVNNAKILRGLRGSTVLASLIDPKRESVWVASLGDCQAGKSLRSASFMQF